MFDELNAASLDEFGVPVILRRDGQPDQTVRGIFDSRHYGEDIGGSVVSALVTTVMVADAEAGSVADVSGVEVAGIAYVPTDRKPDGFGMTVFTLTRSAP